MTNARPEESLDPATALATSHHSTTPVDTLLQFWAKTEERHAESTRFHPLAFHMLDVAFVARAMTSDVLTSASRRWLASQLGVDEAGLAWWLAFLAGTHDIGKASPAFQSKSQLGWDRLLAHHMQITPGLGNQPHALVSSWSLDKEGILGRFGVEAEVARRLAHVIGGHHGQIPCGAHVNALRRHGSACGTGSWALWRCELATLLAQRLGPTPPPPTALPNGAAMVLAGLISVSDWVGSNQAYFPCASSDDGALPVSVDTYASDRGPHVRQALESLGWLGWRSPSTIPSFRALFPHISRPNEMQLAVEKAASGCDDPSIFIIESAMGEGKTEAAMFLARRWAGALGQRGAYFAMPTQATSNQMFGRIREFLARTYPEDMVNLQLLHGLASLSGEMAELLRRGYEPYQPDEIDVDAESSRSGDVVAAAWFAHKKRGLLAPFGVGTIDQAMLAVLQTRHGFVRLFGLAQKTVVLDEVHAYDTYMTTVIANLVRWLGALGSSVVVLSATLPFGTRKRLLEAYEEGAQQNHNGPAPSAKYPRVSWSSAGRRGSVPTRGIAPSRDIAIHWVDESDPVSAAGLTRALLEVTAKGGCVAVIRNTVGRAQETYLSLKRAFDGLASDGRPELDLFHARFTFQDRRDREERTLRRFGKPTHHPNGNPHRDGPVVRPERGIVVATQVIEQSLDLDFDLIVTDFAPVDLLLQRVGRLHRHARVAGTRPEALSSPTVWIRRPARGGGDVPMFDDGTSAVYDRTILLRSWLTLRGRDAVALPDDIEVLVESVYAAEWEPTGAISEEYLEALAEAAHKSAEDRARAESEAEARELRKPDHTGDLCELTEDNLEEDDPKLHTKLLALTRLTGPSVPVVLLYGDRDHPRLGAEGGRAVSLNRKPDVAQARELLARSLNVTGWTPVRAILDNVEEPPGWKQSALLRYHRPLFVAESGEAEVGNRIFRYDSEIGLTTSRRGE